MPCARLLSLGLLAFFFLDCLNSIELTSQSLILSLELLILLLSINQALLQANCLFLFTFELFIEFLNVRID